MKGGERRMMIISKRVVSAVASSALLFYTLATPAFASSTLLEISGNGADSDNTVTVKSDQTTTVVQNNDAKVTNTIDASASTGGNTADKNTGGDVLIDTGNATSSVDVSNLLNRNVADVNNCNCDTSATVKISGNGADSDNNATLKLDSDVSVYQDNRANIRNDIDADAKTGYNQANKNTGGDVVVVTGHATTDVSVSNVANSNRATVGGDGNKSSISAIISGNGADSDNRIKLAVDRDITVVQDNRANIRNDIDADAKTGRNRANANTGGDVLIDTGNATSLVDVDNKVNFNAADIDCGCIKDITAKVSGNGADSDNLIRARFNDDQSVFQDNKARIRNDVDADTSTGKNQAKRNTGSVVGGDPSIFTGHATTEEDVSTTGNVNIFGSSEGFKLPGDLKLDLTFSLADLLAALHRV